MSLPLRTRSITDNKDASVDVQMERLTSQDHTVRTASPKVDDRFGRPGVDANGFLTATRTGPVRPLSPDTLSDFSFHEYDQPTQPITSSSRPPLKTQNWRVRFRAFYLHNLGLLYMLIAQLFGTVMNVMTRLLEVQANQGKGMHPLQILFTRMALTIVCGCTYMYVTKTAHFPFGAPEVRRLLVLRGFAGFFGVFGMYYSLMYLPLAEATVITFLAPGLASWACSILLSEPFTRTEKIGGLVSMAGVVLIARPATIFQVFGQTHAAIHSDQAKVMIADGDVSEVVARMAVGDLDSVTPLQRLSAVGVAMLGVLGAATAYTVLRWIGKRAHPLISVNYFASTTFVVCLILQIALPEVGFLLPTDLKDWSYLIFLGVCGFIMQYLLVSALAYEKSSRATNLIYVQMLFALGADRLVFGHSPGLLSILGSSLILGSAMVVALQKSVGKAASPGHGDAGGAGDEESQMSLISGDHPAEHIVAPITAGR